MDAKILSLIIFAIHLFLYFIAKAFYTVWYKPKLLETKLKRQGITGTPYKVLLGDIKEFVKQIKEAWSKPMSLEHRIAARVDPFTFHTVQKYGKVCFYWAGTTPRVILQDPELMKEVWANRHGHFKKPYISPEIVLTKGLTTLEGQEWAKHRRLLNPAFHLDKLKAMVPVMSMVCSEFIQQCNSRMSPLGSCEMDIWPEIQNLTADIISKTAFGSSYKEGKKIFTLQKELTKLVLEVMQSLNIPGFGYIPTTKNRRRKQLDRTITTMLKDLVKRKERDTLLGNSLEDNLLGLMLQSNLGNNDDRMTIEEVIEECKQFYLAGHETTASLVTWAMVVLAMHSEWQVKARQEVVHFCRNESLDYEAITHLRTVTMFLQEVLRLYPPVIASYQHAYKDTKIGNVSLPAGVDITLPTLLVHHDPDIWGDDVGEFNPERFAQGVANATKGQLAFFPFSWGPRTCIGQQFAMIEAKVALSMILMNFSLELSPSYVHTPNTVMMLQPQHGAHLVFHKL